MDLKDFFIHTSRTDRGVYQFNKGESIFISYKQLVDNAQELTQKWQSLQLRENFIAIVWMEQSIDMLQAFIAVKRAGGIAVPLHPYLPIDDVQKIAKQLEAEMILCSTHKEQSVFASPQTGQHTYYLNGETGQTLQEPHRHSRFVRRYTPPEETSVIYMSSGSTGTPKGVMLSDQNLLSNVTSIQNYLQLEENDRVLISKSLGYCSTLTGEWLTALQAGCDLQLTSSFQHPLQLIRFIREQQPTFMCTVPSTLIPLIKSSKWDQSDFSSMNKILVVGGATPPEVLEELKERLAHVEIIVSYGLTEASPRVTYLPAKDVLNKSKSVGIPIDQVTVQVMEQGAVQGANQTGELVVKGSNVMIGYYNDENLTNQVLTEFGLHTRDMGYKDEDGYLYITGRKDNALNVGGNKVYPEQIENALTLHPDVKEVGVTGVEDGVWGHKLVAVIVPMQDRVDVNVFYQFCQQRLHSYQRPREIYLTSHLPKTKSGKIDRKGLSVIVKQKEGDYDYTHNSRS